MSAPDTRPETRAEPDLPECVHRVLVMADTGGKRNRSDHEAIRDAEKWCRARLAQPTQPDAVEALRACEEVLRLIHEAAGPVDKDAPMPEHSTFEAWKMADEALSALTTDEEGA